MSKNNSRSDFFDKVRFEFGGIREITRQQVITVCDKYDLAWPVWLLKDPARRAGRGLYSILEHGAETKTVTAPKTKVAKVASAPVAPAVAVAMVAPSVLSHNAEL